MKQVINKQHKSTVTVNNLLKKGVTGDRVIVYKRHSHDEKEEYAFLRRLDKFTVGFVSLIGGADYSAAYQGNNYRQVVSFCANVRNLYVFKNMEDFMKNKSKMKTK
jgi:hypothetical protein